MDVRYNKNGQFKMIQFTDLHLGEYPINEKDKKTYIGMKKIINETIPDLLVFTGDIIYSMKEHQAPNPKESFQYFIQFINQFEIPYAVTFGNHDAEENITREELREIFEQQAKFSVSKKQNVIIENRENYVIELLGSQSDEAQQVFYVIDSGDYSKTAHSYYAWVLPDQVTWFRETAAMYKRKDYMKNDLVFQHIPLPEYWLASQNIVDGHFNEALNVNWSNTSSETDLSKFPFEHAVFSPEVNSGLFLEMLLNEEVWGMFVGHDHDNTFDGIYKDIHLVYGQSSGYNSYGSEPKGARVIELMEKEQTVKTYPVFYE